MFQFWKSPPFMKISNTSDDGSGIIDLLQNIAFTYTEFS